MRPRNKGQEKKRKTNKSKDECGRCGYDKTHEKCPAMGQQCGLCKKDESLCKVLQIKRSPQSWRSRGLWCRVRRKWGRITPLCVLIGIKQCGGRWLVLYKTVEIEGAQVRFQLDSGSKANVLSAKVYSNLRRGSPPPLKKTSTVLISFSKLKPNGEVVLTSRYNDQVEDVRFFVVPGVKSVLSGHICIKLGPLKRLKGGAGWFPWAVYGIRMYAWYLAHRIGWRRHPSGSSTKKGSSPAKRESHRRTEKDGKAWRDCATGRSNRMG